MPSLRAYLVEDSLVIRDNLIAALEDLAGVKVIGVADSEAAARQWLANPAHRPDLVIIDLFLRGGSGLGLLRALQGQQHPGRRVVLSNYASPDMRQACLSLGADRVFDKSGDIDALIAYCRDIAGHGEPSASLV